MSAVTEDRRPGLLRKMLKLIGFLFLSMVLGIIGLLALGFVLQSRDSDKGADSARLGEECRTIGEGNARTTVCTSVQSDGSSSTTISAN